MLIEICFRCLVCFEHCGIYTENTLERKKLELNWTHFTWMCRNQYQPKSNGVISNQKPNAIAQFIFVKNETPCKDCVRSLRRIRCRTNSAIGQGTILGPILFLIFFDDSDEVEETGRSFNFADDKKRTLLTRYSSGTADTGKLQEQINELGRWWDENDLELNTQNDDFYPQEKSNCSQL